MKGKVLVIDSDADTRHMLRTALTYEDYEVVTAGTAEEGLRLVSTCQPDLVVTEFLVPAYTGRCVVETLHDEPPTASLPVVVWTATALPEVAERVKRARGIYWTKPASLTEVLPRIRALVHGRGH